MIYGKNTVKGYRVSFDIMQNGQNPQYFTLSHLTVFILLYLDQMYLSAPLPVIHTLMQEPKNQLHLVCSGAMY